MDNLSLTKEGSTAFYAPIGSTDKNGPTKGPIFFNPVGRMARDIFVACLTAFHMTVGEDLSFAEVFAGTGIKSARLAVEGKGYSKFYVNDLNHRSAEAIAETAVLNGIRNEVIISRKDVYSFLQSLAEIGGVDALDVDPFGSPAPYIEPALRAVKNNGLISFTATDTAVLSGIHASASEKKYGIKALRGQSHRETAARALASAVVMSGAHLDLATIPLFFHTYKHYVRGYFQVKTSASKATSMVKTFGYISYCSCGFISLDNLSKCLQCFRQLKKAGPYYIGPLADTAFLLKADAVASKLFPKLKVFKVALDDSQFPPYFYRLPFFSDMMNVPTPSTSHVILLLRNMGFFASESIFDPQGVRTDAPLPLVKAAIVYSTELTPKER